MDVMVDVYSFVHGVAEDVQWTFRSNRSMSHERFQSFLVLVDLVVCRTSGMSTDGDDSSGDWEESEHSYHYESCSDDEGEEEVAVKRLRANDASIPELRVKYLDAGESDIRIWSARNSLRMSVAAAIRQIADHPSGKLSVQCSVDALLDDNPFKTFRVFVDVCPAMTVTYDLTFNTEVEIKESPPILKCVTYCGPGTYIFPDLLLRNSLGQFMDFGKVFCKLSELLLPYRDFVEPIAVTPDSLCYEIQNLAYWAEARTSSVFCLEGNGIITGVYRQQRDRKSSGVGYSVVNDSSELRKDTSYVDKLSRSMELILQNYSDKVVNSPLLELLCFLISELSVEEVLHSPRYASALFALFAHMQVEGHASSAKEEVLLRLLEFKSALDDECSLGQVLVPAEVEEALHRKQAGEDGKQLSTNACPLEPVTIVEQFHCHSYMRQRLTELPIAQLMSAAFMRRMRAELSTLCSSLPPSIRFMVLEQNYSYCKFLISGPVDTPYEGGFFVFDMALPPDYPVNSPAVTFRTTGGGTVRFNPNLYQCGKVCLSLLGTWTGEAWDPKISNINQVVQSIAYLIFVEQPYFNEPGYSQWQGTPEGTAQNDEYNRRIRRYTMTHAVLDHLYSPDAEFGPAILQMLRASWPRTKAIFERWADEDTADTANCMAVIEKIHSRIAV